MKRVLFFVLLVLLQLQAPAAYWKHIDLGTDTVEYIDLDSIRFEKGLVYYWKKTVIIEDTNLYRQQYGKKADRVSQH